MSAGRNRGPGVANVNTFTALHAQGYEPLPATGKEVLTPGWTTLDVAEYVAAWDRGQFAATVPPDGNIGLRCGLLRGLDIDILDPDLAQAIEDAIRREFKLNRTPTRVGLAPKRLLPLRAAERAPKAVMKLYRDDALAGKVELLGEGQQFIAFGIHPETKAPYQWSGPLPAFEHLPEMGEAELARMLATIRSVAEAHGYVTEAPERAAGKREGKPLPTFVPVEKRLADVLTCLDALPNETDGAVDWDRWSEIGGILHHHLHDAPEEAWEIFDGFSSRHPRYDAKTTRKKWKDSRTFDSLTFGSLVRFAREALGDPEWHPLDARIAAERANARRIGAVGDVVPSKAEPMDLEAMVRRFVYLTATNEVCDLDNPRLAMGPEHFRNFVAASREKVPGARAGTMKWVPIANAWLVSEYRQQIEARTWRPGAPQFTTDPHGRSAVNIWTPRATDDVPADWQERVRLFLDHVAYLVPIKAERERFLDWFAHIEQCPGETVHSHYLMVAPGVQGIGRNWLASLGARVWAGNAALSVSLKSVLDGKFNAELSEKVLAVVDELHEGTKGRFWDAAEALKSELTRPERRIRPKYGKEHDEFNCVRWLMLSNHLLALPLTEEDRRFWVIENPREPRERDYYERLYGALKDDAFIVSVRHWLRGRSLVRFSPGARPEVSAIKAQMIDAAKTDEDKALDELLATWPADVITQGEMQARVFGEKFSSKDDGRHRTLRAMLTGAGGAPYPKQVKWNGRASRVAILRNRGQWFNARTDKVRKELLKAQKELPEKAQEAFARQLEKQIKSR